jgi:hypothetical protein
MHILDKWVDPGGIFIHGKQVLHMQASHTSKDEMWRRYGSGACQVEKGVGMVAVARSVDFLTFPKLGLRQLM